MSNSFYACSITIFASLWLVSTGCYAVDLRQGKFLHDEECLMCHDSSVYTRENRRILTSEELMARVNLCQQDVGAEWSSAQLDDVVAFLNDSFYKFPKAAASTD
jgi:hypothetical protein